MLPIRPIRLVRPESPGPEDEPAGGRLRPLVSSAGGSHFVCGRSEASPAPFATRAGRKGIRGLGVAAVFASFGFVLAPRTAPAQEAAPTVVAGVEPASGIEGEPFVFTASVEGGSMTGLLYTWDLGDGTPPVAGIDRSEVRHSYATAGIYDVTLTVSGLDGGEAVDRLRIGVSTAEPDFVGEVAGEVPRFPFRGVAGPSGALSGLSALGLLGSGVLRGGVVDLSGMFGVCLINIGFWDDRSLAHISLLLNLPAEGALEPRLYTGSWGDSEDGFAPGQILVNALVLWSDPSYEETKELANAPPESTSGGEFLEMLRQGLAGELDEDPLGPGRNWHLTSDAGAVEVTRITPEVIEGHVQAYLRGTWQETDASGAVGYVEVEGDFTWPIDEVSSRTLLTCTGKD